MDRKEKCLNKSGMTLIEIIMAMGILAIIVMFLTPVMVNAFKMIATSGDRQQNAKLISGDMENIIAGEPVTGSLEDVEIELPGGIEVDGSAFLLTTDEGIRFVDLYGVSINTMEIINESTQTTATTASSTSSATSGSAITTAATTAAPIVLSQLSLDVTDWRYETPQNLNGIISNTTTDMVYEVYNRTLNTLVMPLTVCDSGQTTVSLYSNFFNYEIIVYQIGNASNNIHFNVRPSPIVAFHKESTNKTSFYIFDYLTGWRRIVTSDGIELILTPGDTWSLVTTSKTVLKLDTSYVYARRGPSVIDPASFPIKIFSYQ